MKKKSIVFAAATAASVALLCLSPRTAAAQGYRGAAVKQAEAMPTPKDAAGHPDLSGFYNAGVSGVVDYGKAATGAEAGNGLLKIWRWTQSRTNSSPGPKFPLVTREGISRLIPDVAGDKS